MPEAIEVAIIAQYLNKNVSGKILTSIEWNEKSRYFKPNRQGIVGIPDYDQLVPYLPRKIMRVWSRGKVIVFELENNIYITSQLAMEGKWINQPLNHSGVIFNISGEKWYYDDIRHMGQISIYLSMESLNLNKFKDHGPDLLLTALVKSGKIDTSTLHPLQIIIEIDEWKRHITNKRIANKRISDYLKIQSKFSGIGNYLRSHILYETKIRPDRPLCQLSDYEIESLYYVALDTLLLCYSHHGLTIESYWDPEGIKGTFPVKAYGKTHDEYGNPIIKTKFTNSKSEQYIHWAPNIQY